MRSKSKFFVDDEYLNGYAKLCGPNATMVYLCLCRHSDRHQESFPSVESMATKTGISRDSVMRGIKILVDWNIISKERERREDAKWLNNRYVLLDKSVWKPKPSSTQQHGEPSRKSGQSQVAVSDTKDTHRKDTHTSENSFSDVVIVKDEEEKPSKPDRRVKEKEAVFRLFGGKQAWWLSGAQRTAALALLDNYGYEQVAKAVALVKASQDDPFCPKPTTPSQLAERWGALLNYRNKNL